jgi:hypothetical protein
VADRLDTLVEPSGEPENAVLTDDSRVVRWTGPLFALFSVILLPWIIYLAATLPSRQISSHYDVAWAGFDIILLVALASTAYFALRRAAVCLWLSYHTHQLAERRIVLLLRRRRRGTARR